MLLCYSMEEFVDYSAGSCNFDCQLFRDTLKLAATLDTNVNSHLTDKEREYLRESKSYAYQHDKILLYVPTVYTSTRMLASKAKFAFDDVRAIGFHDSDGNGTAILPG